MAKRISVLPEREVIFVCHLASRKHLSKETPNTSTYSPVDRAAIIDYVFVSSLATVSIAPVTERCVRKSERMKTQVGKWKEASNE